MKRWIFILGVCAVMFAATTNTYAARLFLTTGPGPLLPTQVGGVPVIDATAGGEYDMHVWILPDANQHYQGAAWSLQADDWDTTGSIVALSNVTDNPNNTGNSLPRWSNLIAGTALNDPADVDPTAAVDNETFVMDNAGGLVLVGNSGIGTLPQHLTDTGRDPSGAFHMGTVRVRVNGPNTVGLYLRQGNSLMNIRNGAGSTITTQVPLFFGDNVDSPTNAGSGGRNRGDALDPVNHVGADAIFRFQIEPPAREIIEFTPDPMNTGPDFTTGPPSGHQVVNFAVPAPGTMLQLEALGAVHSFFDVFVDLNVNDAATLLGIRQILETQEMDDGLNYVRVIPDGENLLGTGIDYDIHLQYSNVPGSNRFFDIKIPVDAAGIVINNIAIPEPSTWVLVACGLLGLAMARRRRAA